MAAWLRLPRADGLSVDLPDAPGLCETCRRRGAREGSRYCSAVCYLFDDALDRLAGAYAAADLDRGAAPVIVARTRLRAIAAVFDSRRLAPEDRRGAAAAWDVDVADGLLLPIPYREAVAEVRRLIARADAAARSG
jgi:hypothetical protein